MERADVHSRVVGWLKVALPLVALGILSTLFLLADRIDPEAAIPYADVDVEDLARDPRMSSPTYAGTTSDGAGIIVSAQEARPAGDGKNAVADEISAVIETPDGGRIDIAAARVELNEGGKNLVLEGGVTLTTSTGYQIKTEGLNARLDQTGVESTAPVEVTAPMGQMNAEGFTLRQDANDASAYLLVFNGGVKLVYQPGQTTP